MIYALSAIIILSVSYFGFAGAVVEPSSAHLEQFVGLGANGNAGVMSCPNCTTHTAPQGYYPMMGMNSGTQEIAGGGDASKKGIIGSTSVMLSKMIDYIPDKNLKSGLQEYMKIVNPKAYQAGDNDVGGQNAGLARYFSTRFCGKSMFSNCGHKFL